ncbi:MAG: efflux RND transporter periplasmic adaptor subunit [Clostridia bacterium]|nr:efflux RND transporter periplasmic adaptor subunit [Clostridia bacterium]
MNKKIVAVIMSFSLAAACLTGCGSGEETEQSDTANATNVTIAAVETRNISSTASYTGELMTSDTASVTSKVSAKITSINCEVGDYVKAGDALIVLDSSDYEYQLKSAQATKEQADAAYKQAEASVTSAEAGVASAEAALNSAQVAYNNVANGSNAQTQSQLETQLASAQIAYNDAKTNYDRQEQLYNMGAISLSAFESAQTALETAKLNLDSAQTAYDLNSNVLSSGNEESAQKSVETAEASVNTAKAQLESAQAALTSAKASQNAAQVAISQAQTSIANTKVTAPISGYISAKNVTLGQYASTGVSLLTITGIGELEAEIQVTEAVVPYLSVGGEALITVSSAALDTVEGAITVINPVKNSQGMYTVRVSVPNDDDTLKVGMFADVVLVTDQSESEALAVPANSILQESGEYYVYVASGSFAEKRSVVTGVSDGEYTQIVSGLSAGENVVVSGKEYLSEENNMINIVE